MPQRQVVAVWPVLGEAALDVGGATLVQLAAQPVGVRRLRTWEVAQLDRLRQPEISGAASEVRRDRGHGPRAVGDQLGTVPRELGVPGIELGLAREAGANPADERVALRERTTVGRARLRPSGPKRRHDLVEVPATRSGRALHELEPLRQKHAGQRTRRSRRAALERRAVDLHALLITRREPDLEGVRAVGTAHLGLDARDRRARAHHLALVRGPAGARREAEVQPLEQVGLAGTVRAADDVEPGSEFDLRSRVVAEVAQAEMRYEHQTFRRIGITRYMNPPSSPDCIRPGRSGLMSFRIRSS